MGSVLFVALATSVTTFARSAHASPPAGAGPDRAAEARGAFVEGASFVQRSQWAEAIEAFERARAIAPHAITTYNLGACERAIGHYTVAYGHFEAALEQHRESGGKELPSNLLAEAKAFLSELDHILVRATMSVEPEGATLAVDGRPLEPMKTVGEPPVLAAGRRPAGPGEPPPSGRFVVLLDPGAHVFLFARKGFASGVVRRSFRPSEVAELTLSLDRLPATLHVNSNRARAVVAVNGVDVGSVPTDLTRSAGDYRIVVREPGYVPYVTHVSLSAGEDTRLDAPLAPEKPSIFSRWWFWGAAGVIVAGAAITTYAVTRPEPRRAEVPSGTLGWSVALP